jgi:HSP20 family molecular chaperone IbpA|tara:strand:- start:1448 stop:1870 length:423 start_codon:yes stop_codon:yes gene_type:complete
MGNLFLDNRLFPTDLLFRNFFENDTTFQSYTETKPNYPVDIATTDTGLVIEIAAVGIDKKDINIETADNTLKVIYEKGQDDSPKEFDYIHRGIARRAFNLGWKISPKCDITKISATMDKGLLSIFIPFTKEATPKTVTIK